MFFDLQQPGTVHCIGIGGIGVSSLARLFLAHGWSVSGSDEHLTDLTRELKREGVRIFSGAQASHIGKTVSLVVRSQAVKPGNAEYDEAVRRGLPLLTYPQAMGIVSRSYDTIAIAGAHGKSTTTALVACGLIAGKKDPTVIVGTKLRELRGKNFRMGRSPLLVLEADEYGKAFLEYHPHIAVVTTIDAEHLDTYGSLGGVKKAFLSFLHNLKEHGVMILNADDAGILSVRKDILRIAKEKQARVVWYHGRDLPFPLRLHGLHNRANAMAAYEVVRALGVPHAVIRKALGGFRGAWRRMEERGIYHLPSSRIRMPIYDDYAHHPTEIRATLQAFREAYPDRALIVVFEPHHGYRLTKHFADFVTAFAEADLVLIPPIYAVAGREGTGGKTSEDLVRAMQKKYPGRLIFSLTKLQYLPEALRVLAAEPVLSLRGRNLTKAVLIMMGAGTISEYTTALL
jgi:UDP-N-acetylmuramate--alanine ligase